MMILSILAYLFSPQGLKPQPTPPEPILRMERYLAAHPSFQVSMDVLTNSGQEGRALLKIQRPSNVALSATWPDAQYRYVSDRTSSVEANTKTKIYDEYPSGGMILPPQSDLTIGDWRMRLPVPLFTGNLSGFYRGRIQYISEGTSKIGASPVDVVFVRVADIWLYQAHLAIDAQGKLLRYVMIAPPRVGLQERIDLSGYEDQSFPPRTFESSPDSGFEPYQLAGFKAPLQLDSPLPAGEVIDASSGRRVGLRKLVGASSMLAVVDAEWLRSDQGKRALEEIKAQLGGKTTLLSDEPGKPKGPAKGLSYDPSGAVLNALSAPGSPTFFLINAKGVIERIWLGFSPDDDHFPTELRDAIKRPGVSRERGIG